MTKNKIQIYPVIEMSPWRVDGGDNLEMKEGQDYNNFTIEVFKTHGIKNIHALDPYGFSSIKISDINKEDLKILIEKELEDAKISENRTEMIGSFSGGLVIIDHAGNVINHQCCACISDYKNWKEILEYPSKDWKQVWIGHPWIYVRINGDKIEFSDYMENSGNLENDLPVKMQMNVSEFTKALDKAIDELMIFKQNIMSILRIEMPKIAEEVTELLVEKE